MLTKRKTFHIWERIYVLARTIGINVICFIQFLGIRAGDFTSLKWFGLHRHKRLDEQSRESNPLAVEDRSPNGV